MAAWMTRHLLEAGRINRVDVGDAVAVDEGEADLAVVINPPKRLIAVTTAIKAEVLVATQTEAATPIADVVVTPDRSTKLNQRRGTTKRF